MNQSIPLQLIYGEATDTDGSESLTWLIEDVPVGATLTDGTSSFTATEGNTSVDVSAWDWQLSITPPEDFVGEFDLTVKLVSTEAVTNDSAFTTRTMTVHVLEEFECPIVLDLDWDGIETVALADSAAAFDLLRTGRPVRSGWLAPDDAFLAMDRNANGRIDDRGELFGGAVGEGFAQLAALDSNGDGWVDSADSSFADLGIWQDLSSDGRTDAGELRSLTAHGIARLATAYTLVPEEQNGNRLLERSTAVLDDGHVIETAGAYFLVGAVVDDTPAAPLSPWAVASALTAFHLASDDADAVGAELVRHHGLGAFGDIEILSARAAGIASTLPAAGQRLHALHAEPQVL